jgi:Leucine-rich repeat (LRR) protein
VLKGFLAGLVSAPPRVVLVYFAGHGIRRGGKMFLVPANAKLEAAPDLEQWCMSLDEVWRLLKTELDDKIDVGDVLFLVILDMCQNLPNNLKHGLTEESLEPDVQFRPKLWALCTAAARGQTAKDGDAGGHSPFNSELLSPQCGLFEQNVSIRHALELACRRLRARGQEPHVFNMNNLDAELRRICLYGPERSISEHHDVFICFREGAQGCVEHKLAHALHCRLEKEDIARGGESKKLRVFLKPKPGHGLDKDQVADALCSSRVVILLVSHSTWKGIGQMQKDCSSDHAMARLLARYEMILELHAQERVRVLPLLIGSESAGRTFYQDFDEFDDDELSQFWPIQELLKDLRVESVVKSALEGLRSDFQVAQGLEDKELKVGAPSILRSPDGQIAHAGRSVWQTLQAFRSRQHFSTLKIVGEENDAVNKVIEVIKDVIKLLVPTNIAGAPEPPRSRTSSASFGLHDQGNTFQHFVSISEASPAAAGSSASSGVTITRMADSDNNELVKFLTAEGLNSSAVQVSRALDMVLVKDLRFLKKEYLDDPDLYFLKRWQKEKLMELVQNITAGSASLRDSGLNDSDLSGNDTASEGGDTAAESDDKADGSFDAALAKHPGNPEDFQEHMKGFIQGFLDHLWLVPGALDEKTETFTVCPGLPDGIWSYCMLVWMRFAKDAHFDGILREKWRECITSPSQDKLLAMLDSCLQQESTSHKGWTRAEFKRLGCNKPFAAAIFVTDMMVQQSLKGHAESGLAWQQDVVKSWFTNGEEASTLVLRANKFLREHVVNGTSVVTQVVETQSYIAFMRMTKLASLLLFEYLDTRKLEDTAASGAKGGSSSLFHGFQMFVSSSKRIFSLTPVDVPALGARPTVLKGLRCLARLSAQAWEHLGPMKTARDYVVDVSSPLSVSKSLATYCQAKDYDPVDDNDVESSRAAGSRETERKQTFLNNDVIRDLIRGYLTELSNSVGVYMDSASGEQRQVDGESIALELFPGKSFETKCNEDSSAVQEDLTCPITLHIMQDPVKCSDGKTYERAAIEAWFCQNGTSPGTRAPLELDDCDTSKPRCTPDEGILTKIRQFKQDKSKEEEKRKQDAEGEEENQIWRSRYGVKERSLAGEEQPERNSATCHFNSAHEFLEFITDTHNAQRACLTGPPASGKTVTMLQTVHAAVDQCRRKMQGGEPLVPVFMRASELSKLLTDGRAANEVQELVCATDNKGDSLRRLVVLFFEYCVQQNRYPKLSGLVQALAELFDLNLLLICIDGLDEAAAHRELVENSIDQAVRSKRSLRVLISTREHSYAHSRACFRLGEFEVVKLQPLTSERQMDMIKGRIPEQASSFKQQLDVRARQNPELATSPFLLCLMIEVYKKKGNLPARRVDLYREQVEGIVSRCVARRVTNKQQPPDGLHRTIALMEQEMQRTIALMEQDMHQAAANMDFEYAARLHDTIRVLSQGQVSVHAAGVLSRGQDSAHAAGKSGSMDTTLNLAIEYLEVCSFVCQMRREERDFKLAACAEELQQIWIHGVALLAATRKLLFEDGPVGLLSRVDDETYRFSHLTLQEYLAARCTVRLYQNDVAELVKHLEPLHSRWRREVLQFTACMLEDQIFSKFCHAVLQREDGAGATCELVRAFLNERGESEEVKQMLEKKVREFRGPDNLVAGLCHPSPDVRELLLSEMRQFEMPPDPFAVGGLISALQNIAEDTSSTWHKRRAGILSMAQIAQMKYCNKDAGTGRAETLKWMLKMLNADTAVREDVHFALVKGLGTVLSTSNKRHEEPFFLMLDDAIERAFLEMLNAIDSVDVAEAVADLNLYSDGLVDWLLGGPGSHLMTTGHWPLRHVSFICDRVVEMLQHGDKSDTAMLASHATNLQRASRLVCVLFCRLHSPYFKPGEEVQLREAFGKVVPILGDGWNAHPVLELLRTGDVVQRLRVLEACAEADLFLARENINSLALCLLEENSDEACHAHTSDLFGIFVIAVAVLSRTSAGVLLGCVLAVSYTICYRYCMPKSLLTRLLEAEAVKHSARGVSGSEPKVCRVSRNVPGYLHDILEPQAGDTGPVDRALELLAQCQRMRTAVETEIVESLQREIPGSHEMPGTISASSDNQPCASPAETHQFHEKQLAHGCDPGPHGGSQSSQKAQVSPGAAVDLFSLRLRVENEHKPSFLPKPASNYGQKDTGGNRSIITAGAGIGSEGSEICSAGEDAEHRDHVDDSVLTGDSSLSVVLPKRSQRNQVQGMDDSMNDSKARERLEELDARLAETCTSKSPALHDPGSGPAPYTCAKLWQASQLVERMPLPTAAANKAKMAYPLVCFLVDREDLGDGAPNNRQFAQQVMELVQRKTLGRMLFSAILHCIRSQFQKNPVAASDRLQTLADLIEAWVVGSAEEQVERQLLLKELRIGRREMEPAAWSCEVSVPQWCGKGGLFHVPMRLLLEQQGKKEIQQQGKKQVVANVSVVKADLSEHMTLLEVPEELRRCKEHVRELTVKSAALEALPAWLGEMRNLQKLYLSRCFKLKALPESMGSLAGLQELKLSCCYRLTALPESMGRLAGLQELDLSSCPGLKALPESMGSMAGLQKLNLSSCSGLTALPESMGSLAGLQVLKLSWCPGLTALPESMGRLTGLQKLDLSSCSGLTALPEWMGRMTGLQELVVALCTWLKALPASMSRLTGLQVFDLSSCPGLTVLPESMGSLVGLQELKLSSCPGLTALPESMGSLAGLQKLDLSCCPGLTVLPEWMGRLTGLQELNLSSCSGLTALPESIGRLTGLQKLDLSRCPGLTALPQSMGSLNCVVIAVE